jgi:D-alanyl-D-alanine carboxypeptidase
MKNNNRKLAAKAKAAILVDMDTGKVLFSKNTVAQLPVASLTKLLTAIIVLEEIDKGTVKWNDMVKISPKATKIRGKKINIKAGKELSVRDTLKGLIIASGNDTAIALAEHISGTVSKFVTKMNKKAKQLGLYHSTFVDPHGLSSKNRSTVSDIAKLSMLVIRRKEILNMSKVKYASIRTRDRQLLRLKNTNLLIRKVPGVDGLKTGRTIPAGYCLSATAQKNNKRVLAVVLGTPSETARVREAHKMIQYAFNII